MTLEQMRDRAEKAEKELAALYAAARSYREVAEVPSGNVDTMQDVARDELDAVLANTAPVSEAYARRMQEQGAMWAIEAYAKHAGINEPKETLATIAERICAKARSKESE